MANLPVILVTGASSGIGASTALRFGMGGYGVVLAARRLDKLTEIADKIRASGGEAFPVEADLSRLADIQRLVTESLAHFGQIDVLVNNAGFGRLKFLDQMDPLLDIDAQLQINILAVIQMTRAVIPGMIERKSGHIINIASMAGFVATPTYSIYAASKFAIRGFSEAIRRELGVYGIRVSVLYPGAVNTEFKQHIGYVRKTGITTPRRMLLPPEAIADEIWSLTRHPRMAVVMPAVMKLTIWFNRLAPRLMDRIMEKRFVIPERFGDNQ
jgi:hypothetical protein